MSLTLAIAILRDSMLFSVSFAGGRRHSSTTVEEATYVVEDARSESAAARDCWSDWKRFTA